MLDPRGSSRSWPACERLRLPTPAVAPKLADANDDPSFAVARRHGAASVSGNQLRPIIDDVVRVGVCANVKKTVDT
jgi:hypothetical protein